MNNEKQPNRIQLILFYTVGVYIMSGFGYAIWYGVNELGALLVITAPLTFALLTVRKSNKTLQICIISGSTFKRRRDYNGLFAP